MHTLSEEFLVLCRQLGDAQTRCSDALAEQAAELAQLRAEVVRLRGAVVRLRGAVVLRDTRLAMAQDELAQLQAAQPGLRRRRDMARHIATLVERIASLSRECLRWRLQAVAAATVAPAQAASEAAAPASPALDSSLAAADLVICQTGCISHDEYWRVQDHCRRTGKPCILVDQPLSTGAVEAAQPVVVLRMARGLRAVSGLQATGVAAAQD